MTASLVLAALLLGLAVGAAAVALAHRGRLARLTAEAGQAATELARAQTRLATAEESATERRALLDQAQVELADRFRALSAEALDRGATRFLELADARLREAGAKATGELDQRRAAVESLVNPLRETLAKVEVQLRDLEQARLTAYTALSEQVNFVRTTSEQLRHETGALVTALRAPQARGRWGEMQLRRVVEVAGMVEHCDFEEQATVLTDDGAIRPDLVVRLAGGKNVVVDSKVSLAAYLEAAEATDEAVRATRMTAHARHLRTHVDALATKAYWTALHPTPEFVICFIPGEAFLAPALEQEPGLLEYAMSRKVVIATPTTLIAMLRTIGYAWQQAALTDNAREVFELGKELYVRLGTLGGHVDKLGRSLARAVGDYNSTVGSLERNVLSQARKFSTLKVTEGELERPRTIEETPRPLGSPELLAAAEAATVVRLAPSPDDLDEAEIAQVALARPALDQASAQLRHG
ncbi:MAG TPA: DNA recombination protein RmuC [Mycobacteriales bacterium]|nr:DNA recombination protein RmuC [Mycobacteriales bacterium]